MMKPNKDDENDNLYRTGTWTYVGVNMRIFLVSF